MFLIRLLVGALAGVLSATVALGAGLHVHPKAPPLSGLVFTPYIAVGVAVLAGPGALVASAIVSLAAGAYARVASSERRIRRLGILTALPLALLNMWAALGVLEGDPLAGTFERSPLAYVLAAVAGAVGVGTGATAGLEPNRPGRGR
jgi:hypothetical protein